MNEKLTFAKIQAAKPKDKIYKLSDGKGLFLQVNPNGSKWWRWRYRFAGKEKMLSLGTYPEISLKEAREDRDNNRKALRSGKDPSAIRKVEKLVSRGLTSELDSASSFESVARLWWREKHCPDVSTKHAQMTLRRLEIHAFPWIGFIEISELTPVHVRAVLDRIREGGALEAAHRVKSICGAVLRYAVGLGKVDRDVTVDLRGYLPSIKNKHFSAIIDPDGVSKLLKSIDAYQGSIVVRSALRLAPLLFVRPGELRKAEWSEMDLDKALWSIPAEKMKMDRDHLVPLSRQTIEIIKDLYPKTGSGRFLFPSPRSSQRAMSDNAILAALRTMDYSKEEMTGHGFRAMARTLLAEELGFPAELIEHQLAHTVKDPLGRAYNRTQFLEQRREMMQTWADYLDGLKNRTGKVVPFAAANRA